MNILDYQHFTKSLLSLDILKPYITDEVQENKGESNLVDANDNLWNLLYTQTVVPFNNYLLRDIKIDLERSATSTFSSGNFKSYKDSHILGFLFDIDEDKNKRNLHIIAIEDIQNKIVQYSILLDNQSIVPSIKFITDNTEYDNSMFDIYYNCYRDFLSDLNISIPEIEEEISLTVIDDLRNKITQIVTFGNCDTNISLSYADIGLNTESIAEIRNSFYLELQDVEGFNELSDEEKEKLFIERLDYEVSLFLHAIGDTDLFDDILEELKD